MKGFALDEESYLQMLGLSFSSKYDWVLSTTGINTIAKNASKKISTLIHSINSLFRDCSCAANFIV